MLLRRILIEKRFLSTALPRKWSKPRAAGDPEDFFVDYKRIKVIGGGGGHGCMSFLRLWCNPFAGPDGGDGGNGSHVIFQGDISTKSLNRMKSEYRGQHGGNGGTKNKTGANAEHIYIKVPVGTTFRRSIDRKLVGDVKKDKDVFIAARGGAGGHGNYFYVSNENRVPEYAEVGAPGEEIVYDVELKVIAHAGLVGFPSAGKSTLLRAISRARPKVSCYPFTTINPKVGTIEYDDYEQLTVADLPGLMPGFENNCGFGTSFLKHVERCLCLFYVIDLSMKDPWIQLDMLKAELESYEQGLSKRPCAVVANKVDLPQAEQNLTELRRRCHLTIFPISAKNRIGLTQLLIEFRRIYDLHRKQWLVE